MEAKKKKIVFVLLLLLLVMNNPARDFRASYYLLLFALARGAVCIPLNPFHKDLILHFTHKRVVRMKSLILLQSKLLAVLLYKDFETKLLCQGLK